MNYLSEINGFYDWLELNSLSTSSIALWYALMHINNKCRWAEEFTVATSVLCLKTGLSDRMIRNARNELKQKGRIEWKTRGGNRAASYQLISLAEYNADNTSAFISDNVSDSTSDNLSTLNKHKLNNTIIEINGENKVLPESLTTTLNQLLNEQSYMEVLAMNNSVKSLDEIKNYLKRFFCELANRGETSKDESDAKFHFANWLKDELRKEKNEINKRKRYDDTRSRATNSSNQAKVSKAGIKSISFD